MYSHNTIGASDVSSSKVIDLASSHLSCGPDCEALMKSQRATKNVYTQRRIALAERVLAGCYGKFSGRRGVKSDVSSLAEAIAGASATSFFLFKDTSLDEVVDVPLCRILGTLRDLCPL